MSHEIWHIPSSEGLLVSENIADIKKNSQGQWLFTLFHLITCYKLKDHPKSFKIIFLQIYSSWSLIITVKKEKGPKSHPITWIQSQAFLELLLYPTNFNIACNDWLFYRHCSGLWTLANFSFNFKLISLLFLWFFLFPNRGFHVCKSLVKTKCLERLPAILLKQDQERRHHIPLSYLMLFSLMLYWLLLSTTAVTHQICFLIHHSVFQVIQSCNSLVLHHTEYQCISLNWNPLNFEN